MKTIKSILLSTALLVVITGMVSCKKTEKTSDGIEYTYIKQGKDSPKNGEFILYHLVVKNDKDSTFISTYDQKMPGYLMFNDSTPKQNGMDEIFLGLRKGDSIAFESTALKVFGESNMPPFLTNEQNVKIRIGVIDVLDEQGIQAYFTALQEAEMKNQAQDAIKQLEVDTQLIEDYIAKNNLTATRTESGLYYVIEKEGEGDQIQNGEMAFIHYAGYLMDGTLFDTSSKELAQANNAYNEQRDQQGGYAPIDVVVGEGRVIAGWDEGLALLKKGSKAKFLIPSPLGYGDRQSGPLILPNSVLIFDVEVTDVQK
ncbi:FKBP-type peptidyl-prolyl cis-trans isomerase [Rhodonellum sp.]|uniref:FKBP-type peptidyl-prolyl cis-trans isomerase n=1 Tax=Rhodonellum sp. TaxID=2231180 RepID=UPI002726E0F6|nr:FKBP-type peptidyl-prolyl cis-trans isomerase [Rhodonellum sp.]MDO9552700.1 FKBP-type peptidyl-prolyl cis-trans isomerase [Rhodonellum sp.]